MLRTRLFRQKLKRTEGHPDFIPPTSDRWERVKATARELERLGLEWEIALRAAREMHPDG